MIEIVWEIVVKEEARGRFELTYGPGGAWSNLFSQCQGFRGTTLLRDTKNPRRYISIEFWCTDAHREKMLAEHKIELSNLDTSFAEWTESRTELGIFRVLNEATVNPRGKAWSGKAGEPGIRSRRKIY